MNTLKPRRKPKALLIAAMTIVAAIVLTSIGLLLTSTGVVVPQADAGLTAPLRDAEPVVLSGSSDAAATTDGSEEGVDIPENANTANPDGTYYDGEGRLVRDEQIVGDVIVTADPGETLPEKGSELAGATVEDVEILSESEGETVAKVTISDGDATDAAMDELQDDGLSAQPNFVYHLLEDIETPLTAEEAEAAGVDVDHVTNDPANESNFLYHLYPWQSTTTTLRGSNVQAAWDVGRSDKTVTVATIDTGCNVNHPDLKGNIDTDLMTDVYYNSDNPKPGSITDVHGHGTHVAGIIASVADNGIGGAGTSYNAKVLPIKVFDSSGGSSTATSKMVAAYAYLDKCIEEKKLTDLKVINMSLGGYGDKTKDDFALEEKINHFKDDHGVLTVCAGGNGDNRTNQPYTDPSYPSDYDACLSVTALTRYGDDAKWSDYNPQKDISAPGDVIYSTYNDGGYVQLSGTSMASPLVAGIAALMYAQVPEITPARVIEIVQATANAIPASTNHSIRVAPGPHKTGSPGAIDAAEALKKAMVEYGKVRDADHFILASDVTVDTNQSFEYTGQPITPKVTVRHNGVELTQGVDYDVSYKKNVKPGTATLTVKGKGGPQGYGGYIDKSYTITIDPSRRISLKTTSTITVENIPSHVTFDCTYHTPEPLIQENGQDLILDEDYTLSYANNKNAGTASVIITGKGLYTDTRTETFVIDKADGWLRLDSAAFGGTIELVGAGKVHDEHIFSSPEMTFTASSDREDVATVQCISEYQNLVQIYYNYIRITPHNPGDAVITLGVNPNGNYNEVTPIKVKVKVLSPTTDLSNAVMDDIEPRPYTGQTIYVEPAVTLAGKQLVKGRDFTYSYSNCKNAGTGYVYANGIGSYTGKVSTKFTILPADPTLTLSAEKLDLNAGQSADVNVTYVADDSSYIEVTSLNPDVAEVANFDDFARVISVRALKSGSAAIRVKAHSTTNYNEAVKTLVVSVDNATVPVDSVAIDPESLDLTVGDTAKLTATVKPDNATEQAVTWNSSQASTANVDASGKVTAYAPGSARITATAGGRSSSIDVTVKAKAEEPGDKPDVSKSMVTITPTRFTYTGGECTPSTQVILNERTLVRPTDYYVTYENNVNAGEDTAFVVITGQGDYTGERRIPFSIDRMPSSLSVSQGWSGDLTVGKEGAIIVKNAVGEVGASSSQPNVATADMDGQNVVVKALEPGTATITVTCAGDENHANGSTTLTITVVAGQTPDVGGETDPSPDPTPDTDSDPKPDPTPDPDPDPTPTPGGGSFGGGGGGAAPAPAPGGDESQQPSQPELSQDVKPVDDLANQGAKDFNEADNAMSVTTEVMGEGEVTWTVTLETEAQEKPAADVGGQVVESFIRSMASKPDTVRSISTVTGSKDEVVIQIRKGKPIGEDEIRKFAEKLGLTTAQLGHIGTLATGSDAKGEDLVDKSCQIRVTATNGKAITYTLAFKAAPSSGKPDPTPTPTGSVKVYRLYNQWSGEHLFTKDPNERSTSLAAGWTDEGVAWTAPASSSTPVYRLYNQWSGEHLYTAEPNERKTQLAAGWTDEDVAWYSDDAKGTGVYRLFNQWNPLPSSHHYTTSQTEYAQLVRDGWNGENIKWYGVK